MKHTIRILPALVIASFILSACGGAANTPLPSVQKSPLATGSFVIHWTSPHSQTHLRRRPQFISPSAKSVAIEVNNDPTLTTTVNNVGTPTSTVTFRAPVGTDTIIFSLWDATNGSGNQLGQASISATIAAGIANTVSATIDGIVSSVLVTPQANQPFLSASSASGTTTFTITGDLPQHFTVSALDADGNVIVPDGDPIAYSITSQSTSFSPSTIDTNNQFTVQIQQTIVGLPPAFTVKATDGQGDVAQSNYQIATIPLLLIGYTNTGTGGIVALHDDGTPQSVPGNFPGITSPRGMMYAPDLHRLFALDADGSLHAYTFDGNTVTAFNGATVTGATALTYDVNNQRIYVSTPTTVQAFSGVDGSAVTLTGTFPGLINAVSITANIASQTIDVADAGNNHILHFDENGNAFAEGFPFPSNSFDASPVVPSAIVANDVSDIIYVGNDGTADQLNVTVNNRASGTPITQGLNGPDGVAFDVVSRTFFVANATSGTVSVYNPFQLSTASLLQTITAPSGFSHPTSVTFVP